METQWKEAGEQRAVNTLCYGVHEINTSDSYETTGFYPNLVPRVFSAVKMAGWRRPWQTAGHVSPRILEILIYSIWRKEVSLMALSKQEIRATGRYGQLIY